VPELPADDRGLIDAALAAVVTENQVRALRWEAVVRFHDRREAEAKAGGFSGLTPLEATLVEFAPLLNLAQMTIQVNLDLVQGLRRWFPTLWARCREGRMDLGYARLAHDQLGYLTNDADRAAYAELVAEYVERVDVPDAALFPVPRRLFAGAVRRRCRKFPQRGEEDSFAAEFTKRRVRLRPDEEVNGMATLSVRGAVHTATVADYRLTLIAKKLQARPGEERTLEQLRADAALGLLTGTLRVRASTAALETDPWADPDDQNSESTAEDPGEQPEPPSADGTQGPEGDGGEEIVWIDEVGAFARPILNISVPITTVMGASDQPGVMAGGTEIPADLVRILAADPNCTWYRMLTDEAGRTVDLSTEAYTPSKPIWCFTVARDQTCVWPGCARPATLCELDHRIRFPLGPTCICNLQPLCRRHHLVKHSGAVTVVREPDGSYTWTTRFGTTFTTPATTHPAPVWPPLGEMPVATAGDLADVGDAFPDDPDDLGDLLDPDRWDIDEWDPNDWDGQIDDESEYVAEYELAGAARR
jgi:hypothetical protein